jgi:hypothetical protein
VGGTPILSILKIIRTKMKVNSSNSRKSMKYFKYRLLFKPAQQQNT